MIAILTNPILASSQGVVATSTQSSLEQISEPQYVFNPNTGKVRVESVVPAGVSLNSRAVKKQPNGLRISPPKANQDIPRPRSSIPTADLVTRSGFKVGTKLLIKIDPSASESRVKIPQLILDNFSLQNISEPDQERYQLHETFEDEVLYLFGRRPRIWTLQGIILNGKRANGPPQFVLETPQEEQDRLSQDMDFANTLLQDWEDYYRGSKSIEVKARTYISYEETLTEATLLDLTIVRNASVPGAAGATITFVVHQRAYLGQEYRRGLTAPNLADLIHTVNNGGEFSEKVTPSEIIRSHATAAEISRQAESARLESEAAIAAEESAREELRLRTAAATELKTELTDLELVTTFAEKVRAEQAEASLQKVEEGKTIAAESLAESEAAAEDARIKSETFDSGAASTLSFISPENTTTEDIKRRIRDGSDVPANLVIEILEVSGGGSVVEYSITDPETGEKEVIQESL